MGLYSQLVCYCIHLEYKAELDDAYPRDLEEVVSIPTDHELYGFLDSYCRDVQNKPEVASFPLDNAKVALVVLHGVSTDSVDTAGNNAEKLALMDSTRLVKMMLADFREKATVVIHKDKL